MTVMLPKCFFLVNYVKMRNTLAPGWFRRFSQKKQQFLVALPTP